MIISDEFATILILKFGDEIRPVINIINEAGGQIIDPKYTLAERTIRCRELSFCLFAEPNSDIGIIFVDDDNIMLAYRRHDFSDLFNTNGEIFC